MRADEVKAESRRLWGTDPAGGLHAEASEGTASYFAQVEAARYAEQPWMQETFRYDEFENRRVLEIGVGLGTDHLQFARAGAHLTGIDLTQHCVDLTQQRFAQQGFHSDLRVMDAENLKFDDNAFDVVYSFGVLHHTPGMEQAISEVRRVLAPSGRFIGGLYNRDSAFIARCRLERLLRREGRYETWEDRLSRVEYSSGGHKPLLRLSTARTLRRLLQSRGFREVRLRRRHAGVVRSTALPTVVERAIGATAGWYLIHDAR